MQHTSAVAYLLDQHSNEYRKHGYKQYIRHFQWENPALGWDIGTCHERRYIKCGN